MQFNTMSQMQRVGMEDSFLSKLTENKRMVRVFNDTGFIWAR